ncbi:MAG: ATP-dependent helicase [Desulfobacterales bacterium]|nr:ATP-dependent helicase [Desulfobacterales bacterium]
MGEIQIQGPPGTGKTTRLATKEIPDAARKFGSHKIVVTSFTKTGAKEIANKPSVETGLTIPVDSQNVGTLHSLCFRAIGNPVLAEANKKVWNAEFPQYPMEAAAKGNMDEGGTDESSGSVGERLLGEVGILRAKMIPEDMWPGVTIKAFYKAWCKFKSAHGFMDFTDLIEVCLRDMPYAPGHPDVIFVDEAQDFTKLQLSLVRSWGQEAQWLVLVGDDDQCIYRFTGASPEAFIRADLDQKFKRVLGQSYRVPQAVLERAMKLIKKVSVREPKEYAPRLDESGVPVLGLVRRHKESYKSVKQVIREAKEKAANGKTVMFLASCSYMVEPLKAELRSAGIPFHNPYRKRRGDWNPLQSGGGEKNSARDLLAGFFGSGEDGPYWDIRQFLSWAKYLKVGPEGLIRKNGKAGIKALEDVVIKNGEGLHTARGVLSQILTDSAVEHAMGRDVKWLFDQVQATRQEGLKYPLQVLGSFGLDAVLGPPKIVIGTIHSVKGGEADSVYLFPDISFQANQEILGKGGKEARDSLYRLFYVGMTRAKEELIIMAPSNAGRGKASLCVEL